METSSFITATKGRGRPIIPAFAEAAGAPVLSAIHKELTLGGEPNYPGAQSCTPPHTHTHTHTHTDTYKCVKNSSMDRADLSFCQGEGREAGWNAPGCSRDGCHARLTVTRCTCSPHVAMVCAATPQVSQPLPSYAHHNPPKQLDLWPTAVPGRDQPPITCLASATCC